MHCETMIDIYSIDNKAHDISTVLTVNVRGQLYPVVLVDRVEQILSSKKEGYARRYPPLVSSPGLNPHASSS